MGGTDTISENCVTRQRSRKGNKPGSQKNKALGTDGAFCRGRVNNQKKIGASEASEQRSSRQRRQAIE